MTEVGENDPHDRLTGMVLVARSDLEVSRHVFANKVAYVLRDPITLENHRFSLADYEIFVQITAGKSLGQVFEALLAKGTVTLDERNDFFRYAANLVQLGLVGVPSLNGQALFQRAQQRKAAKRRGAWKNFLFQQIPLVTPDRFLGQTIHLFRFLFSRWFISLWAVGMLSAGSIVLGRWSDFLDPLADILTLQNLPLLWLVLLCLKVFHEFGHAYACKHFGGNVPSMGLYLIAFNPCAFVDASAAWGFPCRWHRVFVSLGGMYFESLLGIIAVFVWAFATTPWLISIAHHVIFMATAVTLLFNANPLMKYDGYFVLCDLTGNPNLRQRSADEFHARLKRLFLGLPAPTTAHGKVRSTLLIAYGLMASLYKSLVVLSISAMIATQFAGLGLAMAAYYIISSVIGAVKTTLVYLWFSEEVSPVKSRATVLSYGFVVLVPLIFCLPIPTGQYAAGRLATESYFTVVADTGGIVRQMLVTPGQLVAGIETIAVLENDDNLVSLSKDVAELKKSLVTMRSLQASDRGEAAKIAAEIEFIHHRYEKSDADVTALQIVSAEAGVVTDCLPDNQLGQFLKHGTTVAVVASGEWVVRVLANSEIMSSTRPVNGDTVQIRFRSQPARVIHGTIVRVAESGERKVENESLTHLAGGDIAVNPLTMEANESFFELFIRPDDLDTDLVLRHGMLADVRMNRGLELIGQSLYRRVSRFINHVLAG